MKQLQEFIILSAELSSLSDSENLTRSLRLKHILFDLKLPFQTIEGVYKGNREVSFMVVVKNESEIEVVKDLGLKTFGQESVLFRDYKGNASLLFGNGDIMHLGVFKQVDNVDNEDNYSVVDGNFWVCR